MRPPPGLRWFVRSPPPPPALFPRLPPSFDGVLLAGGASVRARPDWPPPFPYVRPPPACPPLPWPDDCFCGAAWRPPSLEWPFGVSSPRRAGNSRQARAKPAANGSVVPSTFLAIILDLHELT